MAASNPPVNAAQYIVYVTLQDMANPGSYKANPTLAAGDVKVSIDGGSFNNLGTLPTVTPAAGIAVKVTCSGTEMTGDNIFVQFIDQTNPKEWADYAFNVQTVAAIWLTPTTAGRALDVSAGGEAGVDWANVGSPTTTNGLTGTTIATSQVAASVTAGVTVTTNNDKTGYALTAGERTSIADAHLDETAGIETGLTVRQGWRLTAAALLGKVSGAATNAPVFRDTGDSKNRISAVTDANGNRISVTLDAS